jgi:predicted dehydrogenase
MSKPVRIGVIGCGSVSSKYLGLARNLHAVGKAEVVIGCDINPSRRAYLRDDFGVDRFTTNYEDVLSRDDVDLVLVLTSMPEHGPLAKAALLAGKHVIVEKPMAVTLPEAAELVEIAKTSKGFLLPAPHVVLSPTFQTIWRRVKNGDIGKVHLARAMYGWAGPSWGQWFYQTGGGPLFDLGVYNVTSLTGILGPAKRVTCMAGTAIPERVVDDELIKVQTEDNMHILLDFGEATFAVITTGFTIQAYRTPAIELYGGKGTIQMMGDDWDPDGYELWQNDVGAWQVYGETDASWPWVDGLRHAVDCIRTGQRPLITPEHGYHVLEIMIKALESARTGQAISLESTFTPPVYAAAGKAEAAHLIHDPT